MKHLNPRQGITTALPILYSVQPTKAACETPKSPPGDYNRDIPGTIVAHPVLSCETPKSPPGDYNLEKLRPATPNPPIERVKHLNPRQGITTQGKPYRQPTSPIQCETPKSPPGDYNPIFRRLFKASVLVQGGVKHLNPRQGITTHRRNRQSRNRRRLAASV